MASGLLINFNNTAEYSLFYKLTSTAPYPATFRLYNPTLSSYRVSLSANNTQIYNQVVTDPLLPFYNTSLIRTTPCLCSFFVRISGANDQFLSSFALSAKFVSYFLSADFIGFPRTYFTAPAGTIKTLTYNDYIFSPGMFFYGEGHTETIFLSARNVSPFATNYNWRINNTTTQYTVSTTTAQPYRTASITLTSEQDTNLRLPVSLHVTNSLFASSDPIYYRDDATGQPVYYPYFSATTDLNGNELPTNTPYHESIRVKPYNPIEYIFDPGVGTAIILPTNGSQAEYNASLQTAVEGLGTLSACYDKYGILWKWTTFENCSANQSFVSRPSTWTTVSCDGPFPKIWRNLTPLEISLGLLSAAPFSVNPIACSSTPVTWALSTANWVNPTSATNYINNTYDYFLSLDNFGAEDFTVSFFDDTELVLSAQQTFTCYISVTDDGEAPPGFIKGWKPKTTTLNLFHKFKSIAPSEFIIYTPNRFVLTGSNVSFQNLITNRGLLTGIKVNFDDNKMTLLTGDAINAPYFSTTYDIIGSKTITLEGYTRDGFTLPLATFPNIIQVVTEYDDVSPTEYRSSISSLQLPWSNKPQIGSNDWVTADNINSTIKKIYENLQYLETRGRNYQTEVSDYFGYLGVQPTTNRPGITACDVWTWEDANCLISPLDYTITWRDVLSGETVFDDGDLKSCGTWQQQQCFDRGINPTCFGRYDIKWQWKALKASNSVRPVRWIDTRSSGGELAKRWVYEPSTNTFLIPCDEGLWNVNIPKLDTYYNPIATPTVQSRCIYYGVASKDNKLFLTQKTQIKLLSSDYNAFYYSNLDKIDNINGFSDLKNISLNSAGYIYVLDGILNQIAVYSYEPDTLGDDWRLLTQWGGFGTTNAPNKFSSPNDFHIDQLDNVWVCDTGNGCVKVFSDLGTWIRTITDDQLKLNPPLSLCVDSQQQAHILTNKNIRVYSYTGQFLFEYSYTDHVTTEPRKVNNSYNREVIYLACESEVVKFFRNGIFFGTIVSFKEKANNINGIYHDEFRNLLVLANDKILKYPDLMVLIKQKGDLPSNYWQLNDLLIHEEEYVQNWVYTKSFQRLWDNIEIFRNTLFYNSDIGCKAYKPPLHSKDKIIIGQNELVTSAVINRVLGHLWDNFYTLIDYFDPNCQEPFNP